MDGLQKFTACVWPIVAVLVGLLTVRSSGRTDAFRARGGVAGTLLVVFGVLDGTNLALAPVDFLGQPVIGYGPRYPQVALFAYGLLLVAVVLWVTLYRSGHRIHVQIGDVKWLLKAALVVVIIGGTFAIGLEMLRHADILPWTA